MARIQWPGATDLDMISGYGFGNLISASDSSYVYVTNNIYRITLTGYGFTTDSNDLPASGTVTGISISRFAEPETVIGQISDIEVQATDLITSPGSAAISNAQFWRTILDGNTTLFMGPNVTGIVSLAAQSIADGSITGDTEVVRGQFKAVTSGVFGTVETVAGTAFVNGGSLDFYGVAEIVSGDVRSASDTSVVLGGDDVIVLRNPVIPGYAGRTIVATGDAMLVADSATLIGGVDRIDARDLRHSGGSVRLVGDVGDITETTRVIGGNDVIFGSATLGNTIYGDADSVAFDAVLTGGRDTLYGGTAADVIYGDSATGAGVVYGGDDTIFGGGGNDALYGGGGNDRIDVGTGTNVAVGGDGDDDLRAVADGATDFFGGDGRDTVRYFASTAGIRIDLAAETVTGGFGSNDTIFSIENVYATRYNDVIYGTSERNVIESAQGNDLIYGRGGGDAIYAGAGDDTVVAGAGGNLYVGGANVDTLDYSLSTDRIFVDLQAFRAGSGFAQGDMISEFENIVGTSGGDDLRGNRSANFLRGEGGSDDLYGRDGNDLLSGLGGFDRLYGGNDNDRIYGGSGYDQIYGGAGRDQMWGGADRDDFYYVAGDGVDRINDFQDNLDTLVFVDYEDPAFDPRDTMTQQGADVRFSLGDGDVLIVANITVAALYDDVFFV